MDMEEYRQQMRVYKKKKRIFSIISGVCCVFLAWCWIISGNLERSFTDYPWLRAWAHIVLLPIVTVPFLWTKLRLEETEQLALSQSLHVLAKDVIVFFGLIGVGVIFIAISFMIVAVPYLAIHLLLKNML